MVSWLNVLYVILTTVCVALCIYELIIVAQKTTRDSFQAINELRFEQLLAPSLTLCPGPAWKSSGPFLNEDQFKDSIYSAEEIFHPITLELLRNKSLFTFKEQYSSYYGLCFVIQKLTPEKVSDYSFQVVVNGTIDYNYYLHAPYENEWLFMNVYPYEVPIQYINSNNEDQIGAADIIFQKEIVKKIPKDGVCADKDVKEIVECWKDKLAQALHYANLKCKVPALRFTRLNTDQMEDCQTKEDALEIEGLIYKTAIKNHENNVCGSMCSFTKYPHIVSVLSEKVLSKEIKIYGKEYFIIWSFYSTLYVNEKIEQYIFDFDSALVAIGGTLGLFLGWSIHSMVMSVAHFVNNLCKKSKDSSLESNNTSQIAVASVEN